MASDVIEVEATEVEVVAREQNVAALVPVDAVAHDLLVRPAASNAEVQQAFADYQALQAALLDDTDFQTIGRGEHAKKHPKKSAWRKLAVAFGVSCSIIDRVYERDDRGKIVRAEVVVRAVAPNGRYFDGLGACDLYEKCCDSRTGKHARWQNHKCCDQSGCDGAQHFSHPQHDIPATAATRATNRACADLFGMGQVSAEEILDGGDRYDDERDYSPPIGQGTPRARDMRTDQPDPEHVAWIESIITKGQAMPEQHRDAFKAWRKQQSIPWPPLPEHRAAVDEYLTTLAEEPF